VLLFRRWCCRICPLASCFARVHAVCWKETSGTPPLTSCAVVVVLLLWKEWNTAVTPGGGGLFKSGGRVFLIFLQAVTWACRAVHYYVTIALFFIDTLLASPSRYLSSVYAFVPGHCLCASLCSLCLLRLLVVPLHCYEGRRGVEEVCDAAWLWKSSITVHALHTPMTHTPLCLCTHPHLPLTSSSLLSWWAGGGGVEMTRKKRKRRKHSCRLLYICVSRGEEHALHMTANAPSAK